MVLSREQQKPDTAGGTLDSKGLDTWGPAHGFVSICYFVSLSSQLTGIIQAMVDGQPSLQQVLEVG